MDPKTQLVTLTLKNLDVVNSTMHLMDEIDTRFLREVSRKLQREIDTAFPDWTPWYNNIARWDEFNFRPESWHCKPTENVVSYAYFAVNTLGNTRWWINRFTGVDGGEMGIMLRIQDNFYNVEPQERGKVWSNFCDDNEIALKSAGFVLKNGHLYRPFRFDINLVADSWPNLSGEVFQPFAQALDDVKSIFDICDKFIKSISC